MKKRVDEVRLDVLVRPVAEAVYPDPEAYEIGVSNPDIRVHGFQGDFLHYNRKKGRPYFEGVLAFFNIRPGNEIEFTAHEGQREHRRYLGSGRWHCWTTDEEGNVVARWATRRFSEAA